MYIPAYEDVLAAHERIQPHIRGTPIRTSDHLNELTGAELFFKCENFRSRTPLRCAAPATQCLAWMRNR